ncbi:MAG: hypothetical protein KJ645_09645, partial [Planctomycetes bacterium]|nr:hypothetical protein [Planctomycetota bacterium]
MDDAQGKGLDPLEAAMAEFQAAWFSDEPSDPEAFCDAHPECGSALRERIESFLMAVNILPVLAESRAGVAPAVPEKQSLETGRILGDFQIIREIGRGGMGVVYEAGQISLKRKVALKVLQPHLSLSEQAVKKFRREAEAW